MVPRLRTACHSIGTSVVPVDAAGMSPLQALLGFSRLIPVHSYGLERASIDRSAIYLIKKAARARPLN